MDKISPERLAMLQYQRDHQGYSQSVVERSQKEKRDVLASPHGTMVSIMPSELRILLDAYEQLNPPQEPEAPPT